jgi:hypothetical protein
VRCPAAPLQGHSYHTNKATGASSNPASSFLCSPPYLCAARGGARGPWPARVPTPTSCPPPASSPADAATRPPPSSCPRRCSRPRAARCGPRRSTRTHALTERRRNDAKRSEGQGRLVSDHGTWVPPMGKDVRLRWLCGHVPSIESVPRWITVPASGTCSISKSDPQVWN